MGGFMNLDFLIPEKFQQDDFQLFPVLLSNLDSIMNDWVEDIDGLGPLVNPDLVPNDYMQHLATLLGFVLRPQDTTSEANRRSELKQIVDWIKMKGTYQSITVIENMLNTNFKFMEMYTNNYVDFELTDWFVANSPGENPPGLDNTYYNSPHFGYMVDLNTRYPLNTTWLYDYLYIPEWYQDLGDYVEKTRPIYTVPHYYILVEPECDDDMSVTIKPGDIFTRILTTWPQTKLYFDDGNQFDDGDSWDQHDITFYDNVVNWKIGSGHHKPTYQGLAGRWKLSDDAATTVVIETENDNDGVATSDTEDLSTAGIMPDDTKAFVFAYADKDLVQVPAFDEMNLGTTGFSVACRVKWDGFQNQGDTRNMIVASEELDGSDDKPGWAIGCATDGRFYFMVGRTTPNYCQSDTVTFEDGEWHSIVGTYDGSYIRLYVDGVADGTPYALADFDITGAADLFIGGDGHNQRYFDGSIDDVQLYDHTLTPQEAADLYGEPLEDTSFALGTILDSGAIDHTKITNEYIEWQFIISAQTFNGWCEIGLYSTGPETLRAAALLPDINIAGNVDIRVKFKVNRSI